MTQARSQDLLSLGERRCVGGGGTRLGYASGKGEWDQGWNMLQGKGNETKVGICFRERGMGQRLEYASGKGEWGQGWNMLQGKGNGAKVDICFRERGMGPRLKYACVRELLAI